MYEYRQVILHMRLGESDRAIARSGLVSRTKAKQIRLIALTQGWLEESTELPANEILAEFFSKRIVTSPSESLALPHKDEIIKWVEQGIQATTIHQALMRKYGFAGAYNSVQRLVQKIKDSEVKGSTVLDFAPGESAQVDFGFGPVITDVYSGESFRTWVFVMVLSWSRHQYAEIVTNQKVETWLGCHRRAFEFFNGVPYRLIIDNPKCAITKACYYDPEVQRAYAECAQGYGFIISACPPREPKKKGRVESGVKYVKRRFLPLREFRSLTDANQQLQAWVLSVAGNRTHGSTYEKPLSRFHDTEQHLLKSLPDQPIESSVWKSVKVHGDCHVQFEKCRYSVPYAFVNKTLWLRANEATIRVYKDYEMMAIHPRFYQPGKRHTLDEHLPPDGLAFKMRDPQWCLSQAKVIGENCYQLIHRLLNDKVLDHLRGAQGVLALEKKYGQPRLEAACQRALAFEAVNYHSIKNILKSGVEYEPLTPENAFDRLADTYTGSGQFTRNTKLIIQ